MKYTGGCHCGNILVVFESDLAPSEFEVRACQCGFCRKHNTRAIADPAGRAVIEVKDADRLSRYQFGLKTAEYLVCRDCGVYVAAVTPEEIGEVRAIVIVNALDEHKLFTGRVIPVSYQGEERADRMARRQVRWTPAIVQGT
jgi:hypothetical protein